MNYLNIEKESVAEAPGISVTLFVSGCKPNKVNNKNCPGCHNCIAQNFNVGNKFNVVAENELLSAIDKDYVDNFVLCGGEPFDQDSETIYNLLSDIRTKFPTKNIWVYTGYEWNTVKDTAWLKFVDVAVIGPFILAERDISEKNPWRGSRNQRVIDVKKSLIQNKMIALAGIINNEIL